MCEPTTIAAGLMILSGAMAYKQGKQDSQFMRNQLQQEGETNAQATQDQVDQIQAQAAGDMSERSKAALQERARLRVASGEFGVGGVSADIAQTRSKFSEGVDLSTIDSNRRAAQKQAGLEGKGAQARTQTGIYQNRGPDALASSLTIAGNVAGLYSTQPKKPTTTTGKT